MRLTPRNNLYFVGGKIHSAWALKTTQGFILLDTIYPYNSEELILGGMQRLGLEATDIKFVVISHAHGDHIGGAEMLQKRGARIVMDPVDWEMLTRFPNRYTSMSPRRDIDAQRRIASQAAAEHATVLLSNHSEFDNAVTKVKMLAGRGDGPHPFEIGNDLVQRYFEVTQNGARAAQIGLERMIARA